MTIKILFICTHNRCRSILAEAITRHLACDFIQVASAGSSPVGNIHPLTTQHLQLRGIDISNLKSQSWDEIKSFNPDIVITVCDNAANEACPLWAGEASKIHWGLPDPTHVKNNKQQTEKVFMQVIETLENRINELLNHDLTTLSIDEKTALLNKIGDIN